MEHHHTLSNHYHILSCGKRVYPGKTGYFPGDIIICNSNGPAQQDKTWFTQGDGKLSLHVICSIQDMVTF